MNTYPTDYSDSVLIDAQALTEAGQASVQKLAERGYEVRIGMTRDDASHIRELALEPSIIEYCPNDCGSRFKDEPSTTHWLEKGRAVYLLVETATGDLAGYAWAGTGESPHIPGGTETFAVRISEKHQGKGLATPYSHVVIDATQRLYGAEHLWLEAWQSNAGAVHVYEKLGFTFVTSEDTERPTASGGTTPDTRMFMKLF
ncbi:GNAT family N-acetyltransferase [Candidatus Saccharibacteria bacterium]|nr:GNAT family N-acetyltransferase [Candidatus Saccharibacteria bacterium]